ncbi:MAG: DUF1016 N-terminal domain-containing protein [Kiritimatiellia bacterium]|nr:DUF1016 N-terminal domain-containing protein [Kiritimatiellia bacterium]
MEKKISADKLLSEIRELILSARYTAARGVNAVQVLASFEIGRRILEHEQKGENRAEYGKALLKDLSSRLTKEFGKGFSRSNLEYMRKFYLMYANRADKISQISSAKSAVTLKSQMPSGKSESLPKSQMLSGKSSKPVFSLSWSQYVFLIGIKDDDARSFYEIEAANNNWTLPELTRQFNSGLYERLALSRDKDGIRKLAKEGQIISKPQDVLKEPYVLEFLGIDEKVKCS